jgi:segregation and condensation protein B
MAGNKAIKSAFESMMFVWGEPLDAKIAGNVFDLSAKDAAEIFRELKKEYDEADRGITVREISGSFQFVSNDKNYDYIRAICTPVKTKRLSQAALEVLAIVAYKQPVTKSEIDSVRGIKSDRVLEGLANKDLIKDVGRADTIGRPMLYGTTDAFLRYFDLTSIKDLPETEDIEDDILFVGTESADNMEQISIDNLATDSDIK